MSEFHWPKGLLLLCLIAVWVPRAEALLCAGCNNSGMKTSPTSRQGGAGYALPSGMHLAEVRNNQSAEPSFSRAHTFGGMGTMQIGKMVVDANGDRYVTGGFTGSVSYGGRTIESSGGYDFFLAKLNPEGDLLWYRTARGSSSISADYALEGGLALALDQEGHAYVGGSFVRELQFIDENGEPLATLTDGRDDDHINLELFVAKYRHDGTFLWAAGGESGSASAEANLGIGINSVNSIMIDREGYPYIVGGFSGSFLFDEVVDVQGESDFYIASLSKDGSYTYWVNVFGTPGRDYAKSISADSLGYLNVLGVVGEGRMDFPNSEQYWDNDTGNSDTFIISYDVNGKWYFASFMGAGDEIVGSSIASTRDGSMYVAGFFSGSAYFEGAEERIEATGVQDGYLVKYDLNGDMLWVRQFGSFIANADVVTLDENENVLVLGRYTGAIEFIRPGAEPFVLTTDASSSIFIAKYDEEGRFLWAKNSEGTGALSPELIYDADTRPFATNPLDIIATSHNGGEILLAGDFDGTLTLDGITLTAGQNRALFMGVMSSESTVSVEDGPSDLHAEAMIYPNYPNPFGRTTTFSFYLPEATDVEGVVYTLTGQRVGLVHSGYLPAGHHNVFWDASHLASGTYVYRFQTDTVTSTHRMTVVR